MLPSALVVKLELIHVYRTVGIHLLRNSCDIRPIITVIRAPDDGCQHPKHVELPTEIQ